MHAIVRKVDRRGRPAANTILSQVIFKSERILDQLRSAFERSCHTMERSQVLHAEMERVLEHQGRRSLPVNVNETKPLLKVRFWAGAKILYTQPSYQKKPYERSVSWGGDKADEGRSDNSRTCSITK